MGKGFVVALTRKNYRWFVNWITKYKIDGVVLEDLVRYFKADNPNFDVVKFNRAIENNYSDERKYHDELIEKFMKGK